MRAERLHDDGTPGRICVGWAVAGSNPRELGVTPGSAALWGCGKASSAGQDRSVCCWYYPHCYTCSSRARGCVLQGDVLGVLQGDVLGVLQGDVLGVLQGADG